MKRTMPTRPPSRSAQRGIALLVVLWACTLLAILLGGYAMMARTEALQARYEFAETRAHYAAEAGMMRAIYSLQDPVITQRWLPDGRNYPLSINDAKVVVSATDEGGKVDLNSATPDVLARLFQLGGMNAKAAQDLTTQVVNWRTFALSNSDLDGHKAPYVAAGLDYGPRGGPFASVEELQMVLGMDPGVYRAIAPVLTIWSGRPQPDQNTASLLALQTLPGIDPAHASTLYTTRLNAPLTPGLAVGGGVTHSIRSEATLADGTRAVLRATIRLRGVRSGAQPYAVLRWQEGDGE
jgi:general secretion pathway protein K